jgi:hypothetical protein
MKSSSALAAGKTVFLLLRWAAVLALAYAALGELVYSMMGSEAWRQRPAPLAAVQNLVFILFYHASPSFLFVAAGAKIAPRARRTTALILAAARIPVSLWNHVLLRAPDRSLAVVLVDMLDHPWVINYQHFFLETLGAVLGVVYIFWSEKAKRSCLEGPSDG